MKKVLVPLLLVGLLLAGIGTALAGPPEDIVIPVWQVQHRYYPDWSFEKTFSPYATQFELRLTGNTLHGEMEYSPLVEPVRGYRFVLVNRGEVEGGFHWELRLGSIHYPSYFCPWLLVNEYWEGHLILDADFQLVEGKFTQFGYTTTSPVATDCDKYSDFAIKGVSPKRGLWCLTIREYVYSPR